ncbi:hypothetical protein PMIT1342_00354 [Prochlorococcus marinus str. MIT 1342]|uniref:hypothetical protein n=1 Tax=Prochlorococcus TaxID=1218 RepID=UPI0007BB4282|nr:hypothetical protein [Prochlorococcus marinus]KZR83562.1 hypothetical protein PMIT1342_00354 [Prochlorococcus marinus str. MIT 1342]
MNLVDHHRNGEADGWLGLWLISSPEQRLRADPEVPGVSWEGRICPLVRSQTPKGERFQPLRVEVSHLAPCVQSYI